MNKIYICRSCRLEGGIFKNAEGGRCECGSTYREVENLNMLYHQATDYVKKHKDNRKKELIEELIKLI